MAEKDGNPAFQVIEVGEDYLMSVEKTTESASDDDDHRRIPENSSSPSFIYEKLLNSNNGEEISTAKEANLTLTTPNNLMRAYRRNPFSKRKIYLGTFNTPEEASNAFAAKRLEFQNRKETVIPIDDRRRHAKTPSKKLWKVDHARVLKDSDKGEESSCSKEEEEDQTRNTPNKFRGIRREKRGRWGAQIHDPFTKRQIWLGTFDILEEASSAYEAKRLEFQHRKEGLIDALENSSPAKRPRVVCKKLGKSNNGFENSISKEGDLTGTTQTRIIGAYKQKHGRWTSETKDPFRNKQINLGMFDTPEEASNAFLARKLEFQKGKEAGEQVKFDHWKVRKAGKSLSIKPPKVVHDTTLKESNNMGEKSSCSKEEEADRNRNNPNKFRGIRQEKSGRWGAKIHDPFTKRLIWLGTFDTPEEGSIVYEAKRLEFLKRKEGLIDAPDENKVDYRRTENSSTAKRPRVSSQKLVKSDNGDEKSSRKEDLTGTTQTKLIGAYKQKSGRWTSETRDPFQNRRINLGMFDTPEEASNAFKAKKLEFQKRKEAGEQVKVDHWKVRKPGKSLSITPPRVHETILNINNGDESSGTKEVTTTPNKFLGAYPRKSGKWFSEIRDPSTKHKIHLGLFDSPEEASTAYVPKKQEFLKLKQARICNDQTRPECEYVRSWEQTDQFAESSSFEDESGKLQNPLLNNNGKEVDHKLRGLRMQKTGRWGAKIREPFRKRDIWLGTFDTLDEASNVYAAKRLEFLEGKEGHISINGTRPICESGTTVEQNDGFESSSYDDCQQREPNSLSVKRPGIILEKGVLNGNKGGEIFKTKKTNLTETTLNKFPGAVQRKSGKWSAEIIDPFHKHPIWFGSFDTPEEASKVYAAKRLEFNERKEAQIYMDSARPEYEPVKCGQQNDVSQISEQILIDSNGFLLGEFSNLDDELRIL